MQYFVKRGEEQYGPYTLEELQLYVQKGNIGGEDLARSEAMEEWMPVGQVLGNISSAAAQSSQTGFGDVPLPMDEDSPSRSNILRLHWALFLVLTIFTRGIFQVIWGFVICVFVRRLRPDNKAIIFYSLYVLAAFMIRMVNVDLAIFLRLVYVIFFQITNFSLRDALQEYYNNEENIGLELSGVMTFFFSFYYFQFHLNRIFDWKKN